MLSIPIDASDVDSSGNVYAGKGDKIYKDTNQGKSAMWETVYTVPGTPTSISLVFCDSNGNIFVSGYYGTAFFGLYRSKDGGKTFTLNLALDDYCCIWAMIEDDFGNLFIGEYSWSGKGKKQLWKSTDGGDNWVLKYIQDDGLTSQDHIHQIKVDPVTGWMYATIGDFSADNIMRSKDVGETWTVLGGVSSGQYVAIAVNHGYVYVGSDNTNTPNKIYRFQDDGGESITLEDFYSLPEGFDNPVYFGREYGNKIFFGGSTEQDANTRVFVYDGVGWSYLYEATQGNIRCSEHHHNGTFFISAGTEKGIRYTP